MDLFEVIKEKVGGKLSDEQIMEITQKVDVNEQVEVVVIDNPIEFEKKIRNRNEEHYIDNVQEFGYIGSKKSNRNVNSKVLLGDAKPGICSITENIDHGSEYTEEEYKMTDFSINEVQVIETIDNETEEKEIEDGYYEARKKMIYVYVPTKENEVSKKSFKQYISEKYATKLFSAIKERVGNKLTDEQINGIVEKSLDEEELFRNYSLDYNRIIPEIVVTDNPYEYDKNILQLEQTYDESEHDYEDIGHSIETDVLFGDCEPGSEYEHEDGSKSGVYSDFSVNKVQVAIVKDNKWESTRTTNFSYQNDIIQIYMPNEREFQEDVRFSELVERNNDHNLSEVEKTVSDRKKGDINKVMEEFSTEIESSKDKTEDNYQDGQTQSDD